MFVTVSSRGVRLSRCAAMMLLTGLSACTTLSNFGSNMRSHLPFTSREPDLRASRSAARNMVELDAATRSGCPEVRNVEQPDHVAARDNRTQRWVAHTCNGDLLYDVVTVPAGKGTAHATVKVIAVGGAVDRPANPDAKPALPGQ